MSKKGLFVIKSPRGKVVGMKDLDCNTNTFDNKMKAKTARDKLNHDIDVTPELSAIGQGFTIGIGPGHWRS